VSEQVVVPFGDNPSDQATLLLAAAEELGFDQSVVGTSEGSFVVPPEVQERAFGEAKPTKKAAASRSATRKKV
jgi:hypothetical protein